MNHVLRASRRPLFFREKIFMGNCDVYELFRASSLFIIVLCRVFCLPTRAHTLALVARGNDLVRLKYCVQLYGGVKTMIGRARARTRVIALNCASLDKFYVSWSRERFAMGTPAARSLYKVARKHDRGAGSPRRAPASLPSFEARLHCCSATPLSSWKLSWRNGDPSRRA
jgi:hypothetical protein